MPQSSLTVKDIEKLRALSNESKVANAIFRALANRERPRDTIDLRRLKSELLKEGLSISTDEYMGVFKKLQVAKFGKIISPRSASDTHRFKMSDYNPIALGKAALGEWEFDSAERETIQTLREAQPKPPGEGNAMVEVLRHMFEHAFKSGGTGVLPFKWGTELVKLTVSSRITRAEVDGLIELLTVLRGYVKS